MDYAIFTQGLADFYAAFICGSHTAMLNCVEVEARSAYYTQETCFLPVRTSLGV